MDRFRFSVIASLIVINDLLLVMILNKI